MGTFMAGMLLVAADVAIFAALWWWRGGKRLPARLEWMREHRLTAWLCAKMQQPVLQGF